VPVERAAAVGLRVWQQLVDAPIGTGAVIGNFVGGWLSDRR